MQVRAPNRPRAESRADAYAASAGGVLDELLARCISDVDGCLLWPGGTNSDGYGYTNRFGYSLLLHTLVLIGAAGGRPEGMQAGHRCHDDALAAGLCEGGYACKHRRCLNVEHLCWMTREENMKGRRRPMCRYGHPRDDAYPSGACRTCSAKRAAALRGLVNRAASVMGLTKGEYVRQYGQSYEIAQRFANADPVPPVTDTVKRRREETK